MENNRNNYSFDGFINNEEKSIEESNLELLTNNYLKLNTNITREIDNKEDIKIQNPNDHLEKELERHDWSELVPEEARKSIALTIDGKGEEVIETKWGPVRVKISEGNGVHRVKAEFDDLEKIAKKEKLSLLEVSKEIDREIRVKL